MTTPVPQLHKAIIQTQNEKRKHILSIGKHMKALKMQRKKLHISYCTASKYAHYCSWGSKEEQQHRDGLPGIHHCLRMAGRNNPQNHGMHMNAPINQPFKMSFLLVNIVINVFNLIRLISICACLCACVCESGIACTSVMISLRLGNRNLPSVITEIMNRT